MIKIEVAGVGERWHGFGAILPQANETPVDTEKCRNEEILTSNDLRHYSHKLKATMKELALALKQI
ncbi:hypothetical protein ACIF81_06700 [Pseudomonas juntendi]|uniref:hypothetical protein n=1 Tax=Pseudomonas juntendi TaxID=2666183 RepID=UPI0037C5C2E6